MALSPATRVNYFDRQFIRLAELRDEQTYHLEQRRRHNLSHHSWGIVVGLDLLLEDGRPVVRPGLAVDGYGRELLLLNRAVCGREQFDRLGARRLDLWLEYRLDLQDDRLAPSECGPAGADRRYRASERAEVVVTRGGARPDPRHPPGVPPTAFEEPMLATPDDPAQRWPVYLGRIGMLISDEGEASFEIDDADRVYVGTNAALIDHPGNSGRIELGLRPSGAETKTVGTDKYKYTAGPDRDFAVFAGGAPDDKLEPTLAVYAKGTQIRGTTEVHGDIVLEGAMLLFPDGPSAPGEASLAPPTSAPPALYRYNDELRFDLGVLAQGIRKLAIGVLKDNEFKPALEVSIDDTVGKAPQARVKVLGDLHVDGAIDCADVRTRTVTEDVAALLSGMLLTTIATA